MEQNIPRGARRVSLTFREVRGYPCDCAYPQHCDSQQGELPPTRLAMLQNGVDPNGVKEATEGSSVSDVPGDGQQQAQQSLGASSRTNATSNDVLPNGNTGGQYAFDGSQAAPPTSRADVSSATVNTDSTHREQQAMPTSRVTDACTNRTQEADETGLRSSSEQSTSSTSTSQLAAPTSNSPPSSRHSEAAGSCSTAAATAEAADAAAAQLEQLYVHQVYDAIASHFSATRFAVWPKVRLFIDSLAPGGVVADVGCGNGKYLGVRKDLAVLGSDRSAGE